jgi:cyclopropane fatty-acyl-phospholipid synthase-like methyltransferase
VNHSFKRVVETGYDRVAERYFASKDAEDPTTLAALEELAREPSPGAAVLDLGCGAGVPVTRWLAQRFAVTGVDLSARQLELARRNVAVARFLKADMTDLGFAPETFDDVVAFHSIIHVPRAEHPGLLERIHSWLELGGGFLATLAVGEREGEESDWEGEESVHAVEPPRRRDEPGAVARHQPPDRARGGPHRQRRPQRRILTLGPCPKAAMRRRGSTCPSP